MRWNRIAILGVGVALLIIGASLGAAGVAASLGDRYFNPRILRCNDEFALINPYLRCEPEENIHHKREFISLKSKLQAIIRNAQEEYAITEVSVYVRDLQFGPWMGINENVRFDPASIMKVPVMMAFLKIADEQPEILEQSITIKNDLDASSQMYQPRQEVSVGATYTVEELIRRMIAYSDNDAKEALSDYLESLSPGHSFLLQMLADLGYAPELQGEKFELSVREVASLFRTLYNASYLSKAMSQKALDLLSHTNFRHGIRSGVPRDTRVAHKFGEATDDSQTQLHDCGIVYELESPYILCVMTRGKHVRDLQKLIHDISQTVSLEIRSRARDDIPH